MCAPTKRLQKILRIRHPTIAKSHGETRKTLPRTLSRSSDIPYAATGINDPRGGSWLKSVEMLNRKSETYHRQHGSVKSPIAISF